MDQVYVIRHKVLVEGLSIRAVARQMRVSRNTVRKYLGKSEPEYRQIRPRRKPVMDEVAPRIEEILEEWKNRTTKKQRITGSRVHRQLVEEGIRVGITAVREYLRERKRKRMEVYIPLVYGPGECAEVDFFEVTVDEDGVRRKAWKFVMRLMFSGRDFVWLYDSCDQISFLDAHVRAFAFFDSVPRRTIYDNLTAAVKKRVGLTINLTDRFLALCSHYLFEPCFARPGEGHDKGGVESRGKGIRLQHLTPIPRGESLGQIALKVLEEVERLCDQRVDTEGRTVGECFAEEKPHMLPHPDYPFEARIVVLASANKQALVRLEGADYSVSSRWARLQITAHVGVTDIQMSCQGEKITVSRVRKKQRKVQYRHYLSELSRKPQAVRQVASKLLEELGEPYRRLWELLREAHGERDAARVLAKVLGAVEEHGEKVVAEALERALDEGRVDLLALRNRIERSDPAVLEVPVPKSLEKYEVASARASDYDELLGVRS